MPLRLSPIDDQVIVLTGATSGIGLATARLAAQKGARLVLVARNEGALSRLAGEVRDRGGEAIAFPADVAHAQELERVAEAAIEAFGGFDSWVNNAGVSVYGRLEQIPLPDQRRVFEVNYWGVVQGSLVAARHLRRFGGGAIVNLGSVLSDRSMILQGPYSVSKHAVKGFTDALRMELEEDGAPISVTLVKPSAMDTPFFEHAKSYLDAPGIRNPPPAYDPALAARAILHACETPVRSLVVGFGGFAYGLLGTHFPGATDALVEAFGVEGQKRQDGGAKGRRNNLYAPREDGQETSSYPGGSRHRSLFLEAQMRPAAATAVVTALGAGLLGLLAAGRRRRRIGTEAASETVEDRMRRRERLAREQV